MRQAVTIFPEVLRERLSDPGLRVFDCRFSLADPLAGQRAYDRGHLPGARFADLDRHLSSPIGPDTGRHPLPTPDRIWGLLGRAGVGPGTEVVVYDDLGGAFALRLWWLLRWIGHTRTSLLDGGIQAWMAVGGSLTTEVPDASAGVFVGKPDDTLWVGTHELVRELESGSALVVDARAPERFRGEVEPIDPIAGHIPGAINLPFAGNLDERGRFLSAHALRQRFEGALGDCPPERAVHSCGSGVNACHNVFAMELAGLGGSRLYAGSWSEWIRSPQRPVATGS
jgi:thiosulfate/3-mercaptopyruvate sulfurtransferase